MGGAIVINTMKALLNLDAAGFHKGLDGAESRLDRFGQKMRSWGSAMTAAVTLPLIAAGVAFVKWASDVEEATSAATQVYGEGAAFILDRSKESATAVGLSSAEYLSAAAQLGVFGQAAGLTGDDMAAFGDDTIRAAADLASFYNVPVPEALEAIRSGLAGETEPLRRFGILINEATLNEYAWANGIAERGAVLTEQQKVLARQGYILENLGAAEGDFARTSAGLANQMRILRARLINVGAAIGKILLPVAMKLVNGIGKLFSWMEKLSPSMLKWVVIIAAAAAALGPLLIVLGMLAGAIGSIGALFAAGGALSFMAPFFAALLGPIGLVIVAVGALAYIFRGELGRAVKSIGNRIGEAATMIRTYFGQVRDELGTVTAIFWAVGAAIDTVFGTNITRTLMRVGSVLAAFVDETVGFFGILRDRGVNPVSAAVLALGQAFERLTGIDVSPFTTALAGAVSTWIATFDLLRTNGYGPLQAGIIATGQVIEGLTGIDISPWASTLGKHLEGALIGARFLWEEFGRNAPFIFTGISLGLGQLRDDLNLWLFAVRGATGEAASRFGLMLTAAKIAWPGVRTEVQESIGSLHLFVFAVQGATDEALSRFRGMAAGISLAFGQIEDKIGSIIAALALLIGAAERARDALAALNPFGGGGEERNSMGGGGNPDLGGGGGPAGGGGGLGFHGPVMGSILGAANALAGAAITVDPFAPLIDFAQEAATKITTITLAIEARVTAMAGAVTTMAFNAGDGFRAGLDQGFQAAGTIATNVTLGIESRLVAFAGAATVAGFNAGDGFAAGVAQGMGQAVGAAQSGAAQIRGALVFNLSGQGYAIGASLGQGIAAGINAWAGMAAQAAYNLVAGAIAAARLAGAIRSPSERARREVGQMLGAGVLLGIRDRAAEVAHEFAALTELPSPQLATVPALAFGGAFGGGRPAEVHHHHHYDFTGAIVGDNAEAWIARVSAREVLPAVGRAVDAERRAQGGR